MTTKAEKKAFGASEGVVVGKAVLRAASKLQVNNKVLANVIGVSEATISRMKNEGYEIQPGQKAFELALLFVRLYRSLDAIVGGDDVVAAQWLANENTALRGKPITMVQTITGLTNVIEYLDARRAVS